MTVIIDPTQLARALVAQQQPPTAAELEQLAEQAEQRIADAYRDEMAGVLAAAVVAVLTGTLMAGSVAAAAGTAAVAVDAVVAGSIVAAAVQAAQAVAPEVDLDAAAFAGMAQRMRRQLTLGLVRAAEREARQALDAARGLPEADQRAAMRAALDPDGPAWQAHVDRVASTTATQAVNEGITTATAAEQRATGRRIGLRWRSERDARVRPSHRRADGQVREIGQRFEVGIARLRFPGDPLGPPTETINCRCMLVPSPLG